MRVGHDAAWYELISRAALSRGRVPAPVLQDEEVARLLPAFFARVHEIRGKQPVTLTELYAALRETIENAQDRANAPTVGSHTDQPLDTAAEQRTARQ
jgi:hypothetical protein